MTGGFWARLVEPRSHGAAANAAAIASVNTARAGAVSIFITFGKVPSLEFVRLIERYGARSHCYATSYLLRPDFGGFPPPDADPPLRGMRQPEQRLTAAAFPSTA